MGYVIYYIIRPRPEYEYLEVEVVLLFVRVVRRTCACAPSQHYVLRA